MSKYTTELRFICEMKSGFSSDVLPSKSPAEIIAAARSAVFNFDYPVPDNSKKEELETKILQHYYTREICCETVGRWQLFLRDKMQMIMPKYNRMYKAEQMAYDRELRNIDVTITHNETGSDARETNATRTDNLSETTTDSAATHDRFSDTPQGTVTNVDNDTYLTEYRYVTSSDSGTRRNTGSQISDSDESSSRQMDYVHTEQGYRGSKTYMELLNDFTERVLNIDEMIVNECADLFFKLW